MHGTNFDIDRCSPIEPDQPIELVQTAEQSSAIAKLMILVPLTLAMLAPFVALAAHVVAEPSARSLMLDKPHSLLQIGIALVAVSVLLGWPLRRIVATVGARRQVLIAGGAVAVEERSLLGKARWNVPLGQYQGIAHRVRTSLSSARHELVLVHANHRRSVLLAAADRISDREIARVAEVLRLPVVPASLLYRVAVAPQPAGVLNKVQAQIAS
jgi:hypothetical protein